MKSVSEWINFIYENTEHVIHPTDRWAGQLITEAELNSFIKEIQQDAYNRAIDDAANKAEEQSYPDGFLHYTVIRALKKEW